MSVTAGAAATRRALRQLALDHGVQASYVGTDRRRHDATDDTLVGVLRALGAPIDSAADADDARRARRAERPRTVEPVVAHRTGDPCPFTVTLDERADPDAVWISLRAEDGSFERQRLGSLPGRVTTPATPAGPGWAEHAIDLRGFDLVPGYRDVEVEGPGVEASALLVTAPRSCPRPPRVWGVFAPVHAIRDEHDVGIGSFSDLASVSEWVGNLGGAFVGTLPVLATFRDEPWGDASPYRPASKLMWDEAYVDLEALPEFRASVEAQAVLGAADASAAALHTAWVDPDAVARKRSALRVVADQLCAEPSSRRDEFAAFVKSRPELQAYARFRATGELAGVPWPQWEGRRIGSEATAEGGSGERLHLFAQWLCERQLDAARGSAGLYLDVPVGVHPFGFDPWRWPEIFAGRASGGAPPDTFAPGGQDWGFPPLHPERIREDRYRYVIESWRHTFASATAARIDHVAGLHRLYWVPEGGDATHGAYVGYRADELYAVLALEAERAGTVIVGEDLGTVPRMVQRTMARYGVLGSWVMEFDSNAGEPFPRVPRRASASLGTHDLPTFDGFWRGSDIDERAASALADPSAAEAAHRGRDRWRRAVTERLDHDAPHGAARSDEERRALQAWLAHLAASDADQVLVDLEDLWLEPEPQNRPGTDAAANFTRRWRRTLQHVVGDAEVVRLLGMVDHLRRGGAP